MIEEVLRSKLLAASAVAALVGTRVYPVVLPQAPTWPALSYQRVTSDASHRHEQTGRTPVEVWIQIDAWAQTARGARQLALEIKAAINGQRWPIEGVHGVLLRNQRDLYEEAVKVYRVRTVYTVLGEE